MSHWLGLGMSGSHHGADLEIQSGRRRITSYTVGRRCCPYPDSAWLRGEIMTDGTHLSRRWVRPREGTATIPPVGSCRRPPVLGIWPALCLEHRTGGHQASGEEAPQRDDQLARKGHDGNAAHAAALVADAGVEPAAELTVPRMLQPQPRQLHRDMAGRARV